MITPIELARFAEKYDWLVVDKKETAEEDYIRFLTPAGQKVVVQFTEDGTIKSIYP